MPVEVIEILGRKQVSLTYLEYFRERWNIFLGGRLQCTPQKIKSGFVMDSDIDIEQYIAKLGISVSDLESPYKPRGTQRLTIESMKEIMVLRIWEQIGTDPL